MKSVLRSLLLMSYQTATFFYTSHLVLARASLSLSLFLIILSKHVSQQRIRPAQAATNTIETIIVSWLFSSPVCERPIVQD